MRRYTGNGAYREEAGVPKRGLALEELGLEQRLRDLLLAGVHVVCASTALPLTSLLFLVLVAFPVSAHPRAVGGVTVVVELVCSRQQHPPPEPVGVRRDLPTTLLVLLMYLYTRIYVPYV